MANLLADSEDFGETWSPFREMPMPKEFGPAGINKSDSAPGRRVEWL